MGTLIVRLSGWLTHMAEPENNESWETVHSEV